MDEEEKTILLCMSAVAMLAIMPVLSILEGLIISKMWFWFFVPLGFAGISIPQGIGIRCLIAVVSNQNARVRESKNGDKKSEISNTLSSILSAILRILIQFMIGCIAHLFMEVK